MATAAPTTAAPFVDICKLSINGMNPFGSGGDIRDDACRGAHALLMMLGSAFEDADELYRHQFKDGHAGSIIEECNSRIKADAIYGIATLLALSQYGADLAVAEAEARRVRA